MHPQGIGGNYLPLPGLFSRGGAVGTFGTTPPNRENCDMGRITRRSNTKTGIAKGVWGFPKFEHFTALGGLKNHPKTIRLRGLPGPPFIIA